MGFKIFYSAGMYMLPPPQIWGASSIFGKSPLEYNFSTQVFFAIAKYFEPKNNWLGLLKN